MPIAFNLPQFISCKTIIMRYLTNYLKFVLQIIITFVPFARSNLWDWWRKKQTRFIARDFNSFCDLNRKPDCGFANKLHKCNFHTNLQLCCEFVEYMKIADVIVHYSVLFGIPLNVEGFFAEMRLLMGSIHQMHLTHWMTHFR